ncbi:hypothetical protein OOZ51_16200 [Arthrobacter sp. MI7-26]|nr:hypothetical protein [Arthrobacter sp. MI7-26]
MAKVLRVVRFLVWLLWPAAVVAASCVTMAIIPGSWSLLKHLYAPDPSTPASGPSVAALGVFVVLVVFVVWTFRRVFVALGMLRRRLGRYTKAEQDTAAEAELYRRGIERAIGLRDRLVHGAQPELLQAWGVTLEHDEALWVDASMQYARWYGHGAAYTHSPAISFERPSLATGSVIGSAIGNAFSLSRGMAADSQMWRDSQTVRTLVTDRRIMCETVRGWISFRYDEVAASNPDPAASTLILEFRDSEPLRLHGYDGAVLCVFAVATLYGRSSLRHHPGLSALTAD